MGESDTETRIDTETKLLLKALRLSPKQLNCLGLSPGDLRILDEPKEATKIKYKVPKKCSSATVHFDHSKMYRTVQEYLIDKNYALLCDLLRQGFNSRHIEKSVKAKRISVAHWPKEESLTDVFWSNDKSSLKKLEELASKAVKSCSKDNVSNSVYFEGLKLRSRYILTDLISFGEVVGSQQLALVGLTYAREQGKLLEIPGPHVVSYLVMLPAPKSSKNKKS